MIIDSFITGGLLSLFLLFTIVLIVYVSKGNIKFGILLIGILMMGFFMDYSIIPIKTFHTGDVLPTITIDVFDIVLLLLIFVSMYDHFRGVNKVNILGKYVLIYLAVLLLSVIFSWFPNLSIYSYIRTIKMAILFCFVSNIRMSYTSIKKFTIIISLSVIIQISIVIYTFIIGSESGIFIFGQQYNQIQVESVTRFAGSFINPQTLGYYISIIMPFLIIGVLLFKKKTIYIVSIILAFLLLIVSNTRASMITTVFTSALLLIFLRNKKYISKNILNITTVSIIIIVTIIILILQDIVFARFSSAEGQLTLLSRILPYSVAVDIFSNNILTGCGLNTFAESAQLVNKSISLQIFPHPVHNIFLLQASETGILGTIGFIILFYTFFKRKYFAIEMTKHEQIFCIAIKISVISIILQGMSGWAFRLTPFYWWFWFLLGLYNSILIKNSKSAAK